MEHSGDYSLHNVPGLCCLSGCTVVWSHQRGTEEPTWTGGRQRNGRTVDHHCLDIYSQVYNSWKTSSCQQQTNDECPAPDHCDLDLHSTSDLVPLLCGWLGHCKGMFWCFGAAKQTSLFLFCCYYVMHCGSYVWLYALFSLPQVSFQLVSMVLNHLSCMFMNFQNKWGILSLLFEIYVYKQIMKKKPIVKYYACSL